MPIFNPTVLPNTPHGERFGPDPAMPFFAIWSFTSFVGGRNLKINPTTHTSPLTLCTLVT